MPECIGFLFPGQGAQAVGMGRDLAAQYPVAKKVFEHSDRLLGYSLSKICFEGPEEQLTRTLYAQPAIFTTSMAALAVLKEKFPDLSPNFVAGLSLGEFTALAAAGSLSFEDGLRLVQLRAQAMEKASQLEPGTMASILGLTAEQCQEVAREAGCDVANLNGPDQTVLSGRVGAIEKACKIAEAKGAKRAIPLKVGGAFHSSLMKAAKEDLEKALRDTRLARPSCIFIPNAVAEIVSDTEEIRGLLARQLTSPVCWVQTMMRAKEENMTFLLEIGPGKILKGLAKKCQPEITVELCGTPEDIQKLETLFAQA